MLAAIRAGLLLAAGTSVVVGSVLFYVFGPVYGPPLTGGSPSQRASVQPTSSEVAQSPTPAPSVSPESSERPTEPIAIPTVPLPTVEPPHLATPRASPVPTALPTPVPVPPTPEPTVCIVIPHISICLE